ncbi:glycerophosphodiester phosphodiesterase family protein [Brevibacillus laterosporus]|uniref:glycerophosphodiester phosphodiesterase n=1 Tax=Brevibacillus laterosporus TaxID=1465 RepID=UPI0003729237|nr:glycerophosphodiester phosphodiesterase family protein [Brevibacillus laterosporus]ATO49271.1 glycerophosphodiester phosphodiesterase [Brevibacillus laterosporus DSM 25]MBG9804407.1 glycerophosphodiester phosphodiesterase [Brevibacillus laterosporus]MED2003419.1 glycerophosphodiester phosphodiesterase family protein [Brevibacillus laterosporus]MED4764713.1 glycerophosphodiester phosphodiesterase family protein [Brevibacillus laterosporus]NKQ22009.1 glycerophosphodiester phosphodiesterase [B
MSYCMAHRGWSGRAPENTMAAIKLALAEPGIQAIEVDVQLSKDGIPVLIHDFTLDRTTNGSGPVKDHTFEQLREWSAGSWFAEEFSNEQIPALEELFQAASQHTCRLNVELKTAGNLYPLLAEKVVELVEAHELASQVCLTSFDHEIIKRVKELQPSIKTGLIITGKPVLLREQLAKTGATILSMAYPYLTKDFVQMMLEEGFEIFAWTIDDENEIERISEWHPNIYICTNHPDRMLSLAR